MGTFTVPIQVGDLEGRQSITVDALAGTDATHTVLPTDVLAALGIAAIETMPFHTPENAVVECDVGEARIRIDGIERTCLVVFGPEAMTPLLGATTLAMFHLAADPVQERLMPESGLLKGVGQELKILASRVGAAEAR